MTRAISGGIDFVGGFERKAQFGVQELLSVVVDIDRIASDGAANNLLFLDQSRSDMAAIKVPVTWYHGRFDAWVDISRVSDMMSQGDTRNRRLVVLPTGHQLKSSRKASEIFQCIASEVGRIGPKKNVSPRNAPGLEVKLRRKAEHARIPPRILNLQNFWHDYLVGRDNSYGIELLASGSAYRDLMDLQVELLLLRNDDHILDLGSGVGTLPIQLGRRARSPNSLSITCVDYVRGALQRARSRLSDALASNGIRISYVESNLDLLSSSHWIPFKDGRFDAVICSLLLSYLESPKTVLREVHRLLRPDGRLVISSLCRDADISKLYVESLAEFAMEIDELKLPGLDPREFTKVARNFLNDAAKILDLEEAGAFHFWDENELVDLVTAAGFSDVKRKSSLGSPPQATVVFAKKL